MFCPCFYCELCWVLVSFVFCASLLRCFISWIESAQSPTFPQFLIFGIGEYFCDYCKKPCVLLVSFSDFDQRFRHRPRGRHHVLQSVQRHLRNFKRRWLRTINKTIGCYNSEVTLGTHSLTHSMVPPGDGRKSGTPPPDLTHLMRCTAFYPALSLAPTFGNSH